MQKRNKKITPIDIKIGELIRDIRDEKGMSLSYLSRDLSVSVAQLNKYELSLDRVSASMLWDICRLYEMKMSDFFKILEKRQNV